MTLHTEAEGQDVVEELRAALARAQRQAAAEKRRTSELVETVYRAAHDVASSLVIPPVPQPLATSSGHGKPEIAVPMWSDWQLAKITPSYNSEVCEERVELLVDKIIKLTDIQRADHPVDAVNVWLLGDIVEGELIFPGQQFLIDQSLYQQVLGDGQRILVNALRRLLGHFERVHVDAVIGNHGKIGGRSSRDMNPESNADRMLYRVTQLVMADEQRLTWNIPDGAHDRNWYTISRIGNYRCMLFHGDQIRGQLGFPWYGVGRKVNGWKNGAIPEDFDDVAFGHWHQDARIPLNMTVARCNGSTESYNTYAMENMAASGNPSQKLLFVEPTGGKVTAEYTIYLHENERLLPHAYDEANHARLEME